MCLQKNLLLREVVHKQEKQAIKICLFHALFHSHHTATKVKPADTEGGQECRAMETPVSSVAVSLGWHQTHRVSQKERSSISALEKPLITGTRHMYKTATVTLLEITELSQLKCPSFVGWIKYDID